MSDEPPSSVSAGPQPTGRVDGHDGRTLRVSSSGPPDGATSVDELTLAAGEMLDHFCVIRELGRGGMGAVYLARDTRLGRKVALKVLHPEALGSRDAVERFLFEARATARFSHPNIVTVYAVGEHAGHPYLALEYLEGQSLRERIADERLPRGEVLHIGLAIAEALQEAHRRGVLHRDLKPENVMIPRDGRARVVDFGLAGLARRADPGDGEPAAGAAIVADDELAAPETAPGVQGTPAYMAPEQWRGESGGGATDVWALGLLLAELLAGAHPLAGLTLIQLIARVTEGDPVPLDEHEIPAELADLLRGCLRQDAAQRTPIDEVVDRLRALVHAGRRPRTGEVAPFKGLLVCDASDADRFHGRDAEIGAFLERMRSEPFLPIVGPSGAGKSSFVLAGVMPRLGADQGWLLAHTRPGVRPLRALAGQLLALERADPDALAGTGSSLPSSAHVSIADLDRAEAELTRELRASPAWLGLRLWEIASARGTRVLLFVDQLEELYTLVDDRALRSTVMDALCLAADDPQSPVRVVVTLRDDYLGRLAASASTIDALGQVTVLQPPGADALRAILTAPVRAQGYDYDDPGLVDEMVAAVRDEPLALPLLQVAGVELWARRDRERRRLLRAAHDEMGGVAGALAFHANRVLEACSPAERDLLRTLMLRLVSAHGTRRVVSRRDLLDGLEPAAADVLDRLTASRLVVARGARARGNGDDGGETEVQVAHESLLDGWDQLSAWRDESREDHRFLDEVGQAAALWEARGRRADEVWSGDALVEGLRRAGRIDGLPVSVRSFLAAGRRAARRRVRLRRAAGVALVVVLAAVAGVLALQNRQVTRERDRADERRAEALREGAQGALERGELVEARAKLRQSLEAADRPAARVLWWHLAQEARRWTLPVENLFDVAFAADGTRLAVAAGGPVVVVDVDTGEVLQTMQDRHHAIGVAFVAGGARVVGAGARFDVWDPRSGERLSGRALGDANVRTMFDDPQRGRIVARTMDGTHLAWSIDDDELTELSGEASTASALSPDGGTLVLGDAAGAVVRIDAVDGRVVARRALLAEPVVAVAVAPDGRWLAAAGEGGAIAIWHTRDDVTVQPETFRGVGRQLVASPDGERLASADGDGAIRLWDPTDGRLLERIDAGLRDPRGMAFSPAGERLAAIDARALQLWSVDGSPAFPRPAGHASMWHRADASADGRFVATCDTIEDTIWIWDAARGEPWRSIRAHDGGVSAVAFTPDGASLASGGRDGSIRVWDVLSGASRTSLAGHDGAVADLAVDPSGRWLLSSGEDGAARLWELSSGEAGPRHELGGGPVRGVAFHPGGAEFAAATRQGEIWRIEVASGRVLARHAAGPPRSVWAVAYSPDGETLASGGDDEALWLWDLASGDRRAVVRHTFQLGSPYHDISFDPRGDRIAAVPADTGGCRIWVLESGALQRMFINRLGPGRICRFDPAGQYVLADQMASLRMWDADSGLPRWRGLAAPGSAWRALTQRGWRDDEDRPADAPAGAGWRAAEQRGVYAAVDAGGRVLCLATARGELEVWDLASDQLRATWPVVGVLDLEASADGCVVLDTEDTLWIADQAGDRRELARVVSAFALGGPGVMYTAGGILHLADLEGAVVEQLAEMPVSTTAIGVLAGGVAIGDYSGGIHVLPRGEDTPLTERSLRSPPSLYPVDLVEGPAQTLFALHGDGHVRIWSLTTGELLDEVKLHGVPVHASWDGGRLRVVTERGVVSMLDLSVLLADRCDVLDEVWSAIPYAWESGRAVATPPPDEHPCVPRR